MTNGYSVTLAELTTLELVLHNSARRECGDLFDFVRFDFLKRERERERNPSAKATFICHEILATVWVCVRALLQ